MKIAALNALAAACLTMAAGPVFAAAYGSAIFGNVHVTLIDLDPNDGIAASISFFPGDEYYDGAEIAGTAASGPLGSKQPGASYELFDVSAAWRSNSPHATAQTGLASVSASVTGSGSGIGFSQGSLSGSALSSAQLGASFYGDAKLPGNKKSEFVLSANTQVIFSIDAALSTRTTIGRSVDGLTGEAVSAQMSLYASGWGADGYTLLEDQQDRLASVAWTAGGAADSWSGVMSVSYSNLSTESSDGSFWAEAQISGNSITTAVPEPSTYGMLLGGLALLAGVARRRRNPAV